MEPPTWVDLELRQRCKKPFEVADYENAVFAALKILETRATAMLAQKGNLYGVEIIDALLSPNTGQLQLGSNKAEQEGAHQTFRGLFLWLRNPSGHRFVEYGREQAYEVICFVDFLLLFLKQRVRAEVPVEVVETTVDRYLLADVDTDGTQEKVIVSLPDMESRTQGQLLVLDPVGSDLRKFVLLEGFPEFSIYFLDARDLNSDGVLEIIASAPVGTHSESMHIFRWDGQSYACVGEFISDAPSIEIEDLDHDGIHEVIVKQRDYQTDPIKNSIIHIYHWVAGKYEIVQQTRVQAEP